LCDNVSGGGGTAAGCGVDGTLVLHQVWGEGEESPSRNGRWASAATLEDQSPKNEKCFMKDFSETVFSNLYTTYLQTWMLNVLWDDCEWCYIWKQKTGKKKKKITMLTCDNW